MKNKKLGEIGEKLAQNILIKKGHTILHNNYLLPIGEIDIISQKGETLFFCEVKTRSNNRFGYGYESVSERKINKIRKTAEKFLVDQSWMGNVQLLIISITYAPGSKMEYEILELY